MKTWDERLLAFMPWVFGFALLFIIAALCLAIGLGKVEEATSFGLQNLIGGLLVIAGSYGNSVFGKKD